MTVAFLALFFIGWYQEFRERVKAVHALQKGSLKRYGLRVRYPKLLKCPLLEQNLFCLGLSIEGALLVFEHTSWFLIRSKSFVEQQFSGCLVFFFPCS